MAAASVVPLALQGTVYWVVQGDFTHRLELNRAVLKHQSELHGVDAQDLFFYFRNLVEREVSVWPKSIPTIACPASCVKV